MDTVTAAVVVLGIIALVFIAALQSLRRKARIKMNALGVSAEIEGEAHSKPGAVLHKVQAEKGNVTVRERTGKGADLHRVVARHDVVVEVGEADPKE